MMIIEAIESAASEHAVYFLASAYVESLHHFHRSLGIPHSIIVLPLHGVADLRQRLAALSDDDNLPMPGLASVLEARTVFGAALARLSALESRRTAVAA